MNFSIQLFTYAFAIPVILVWSFYQDKIIVQGQLSVAMSSYLVFMFVVFGIKDEQERRNPGFLLKWILGSVGMVLLIVAWSESSKSTMWVIGSSLIFFVAAYNLAETFKKETIHFESRGIALLGLCISVFLFFETLVRTDVTPHYSAYKYILYAFIIITLPFIFTLPSTFFSKYYYFCMWALLSISLFLFGRRWSEETTLPYYLIIQPIIGICSIQIIRYIRDVEININSDKVNGINYNKRF
tara:strand:- start:103 stop:828 length:726 start_codon:yes stop_codon:yes gene_type:complete